jgi:hypothetical protein
MKQQSFYKHLTKHKGSMDPLLVGREGLFDNDCFFYEMVTWMEDTSCVQIHVH